MKYLPFIFLILYIGCSDNPVNPTNGNPPSVNILFSIPEFIIDSNYSPIPQSHERDTLFFYSGIDTVNITISGYVDSVYSDNLSFLINIISYNYNTLIADTLYIASHNAKFNFTWKTKLIDCILLHANCYDAQSRPKYLRIKNFYITKN